MNNKKHKKSIDVKKKLGLSSILYNDLNFNRLFYWPDCNQIQMHVFKFDQHKFKD